MICLASKTGSHLIEYQLNTPLGGMIATYDSNGLRSLYFAERQYQETVKCATTNISHSSNEHADPNLIYDLVHAIDDYFCCRKPHSPIGPVINPPGSSFQIQVWQALQAIPIGQTRSYAQIASAIGRPSAYRAVASAIGRNPIAILIPCHRVICSDGGIGGYNGGQERKHWLLQHEASTLR